MLGRYHRRGGRAVRRATGPPGRPGPGVRARPDPVPARPRPAPAARSWTTQACAELRAAESFSAGAAPPAPDALTPQQGEIARLVASGATNREIASRLFLSPRTVAHHLRNVFVRPGVRSRGEPARIVD